MKQYAAHYEPEIHAGRVFRCVQTSSFFKTASEAEEAGKADEAGRPFVVADSHGVIVPAHPAEPEKKKKGGILG